MEGVVWAEQLAQAATCLVGLGPAILRELDAVIGDRLVYLAVLWTRAVSSCLAKGIEETGGRKAYCCPRIGRGG